MFYKSITIFINSKYILKYFLFFFLKFIFIFVSNYNIYIMAKHILNLLKVSQMVDKNSSKLYYHLNLAMKGVVGQVDKETLQKLKKVLVSEHQKNLKFIDDLIKKGEAQQSDLKNAS